MRAPSASIASALMLVGTQDVLAQKAATDSIASAQIIDAFERSVGSAAVWNGPDGVLIRIEVRGLTPGWHGIHVHETGLCQAPDFQSAGAHVGHGSSSAHGLSGEDGSEAGDLPNLFADSQGNAHAEFFSDRLTLDPDQADALRHFLRQGALVVHAQPDDGLTQPSGGAGGRVACGVLNLSRPETQSGSNGS